LARAIPDFYSKLLLALLLGAATSWPRLAEAANELKRQVNLEWEEIEDATLYEIQVTRILKDGQRKKPLYFKLKKARWAATVNPGRYEMRIRSYDQRGVPGEWADPMEFWVKIAAPETIAPLKESKIKTEGDEKADVEFRWNPVEGASSYELTLESLDGKIKESKTLEGTSLHLDLPVAASYNWKVTAVMPEGEKGEDGESALFSLLGRPLETPQIEKPLSRFVREMKWERPDHVESFSYVLYRKSDDGRWRPVEKKQGLTDASAPFDLARPSGEYRLRVRAEAPGRENSAFAQLDFEVHGDLHDPGAVDKAILKDSLEKPTRYYAIASYFITQIKYSSRVYETAQKAQFDAVGGTGRLGLGYQSMKRWGAFGIVDMGGFNIGNKNFTFASAELHGTWKLNWSSSNQVLFGAGLYYKELPQVQGNASSGFEGVGVAKSQGPHAGLRIWIPLTQKLGLQMNGRLYYSLTGATSSGQGVQSALSYQLGALGSLRLSPELMGYAGYAYRLDQAHYNADTSDPYSAAQSGDVNSIEIQGHYLNLMLEYSF
jgi:hypothetical protein